MRHFILYFNAQTLESQATFSSYKAIVKDIKKNELVKPFFKGIACNIDYNIFFIPELEFYNTTEDIIKQSFKFSLDGFIRFIKNNNYFIFNFTHGKYGEDGIFQSVCTYFDIPTNLRDYESAFLTYNKYNTLLFVRENIRDVYIPKTFYFNIDTKEDEFDRIIDNLDKDCSYILKANNLGSSIAMERYDRISVDVLVDYKMRNSQYTNSFIIQEVIDGKEVTVGVYKYENKFIDLPLIVPESKKKILDFFVKHSDNGISIKVFKEKETEQKLKLISTDIYNKMNLSGAVRIDYIITDDRIYFLEINLFPGLGEHSVLPIMLEMVGISRSDFIKMSIDGFYYGKTL